MFRKKKTCIGQKPITAEFHNPEGVPTNVSLVGGKPNHSKENFTKPLV